MSSPLLRTVHRNERLALITEGSLTSVLPYAAVVSLGTLRSTPSVLRAQHPCTIEPLPGVLARSTVVQHCPTLGYRILWCHVDNNSYRRHYLRFLQIEHGWRGSSIPAQWHVDHVFNRARAKRLELEWVRMMLLPGPVNTSNGAGYEKQRTRSRITGRVGRDRLVDEITLAKVSGVRSPRRRGDTPLELMDHARRIAKTHGLSTHDVVTNISDLLTV